jgi:hypothetical protein
MCRSRVDIRLREFQKAGLDQSVRSPAAHFVNDLMKIGVGFRLTAAVGDQ